MADPADSNESPERAAAAARAGRAYLDAQREAALARERAHWGKDPARDAYHAAAARVREALDALDIAVRDWDPARGRKADTPAGAEGRTDALEDLIGEATERLTRLQTVTAALSQALTPDHVAEIAVTQAVAAMGALAGSIVAVDTEENEQTPTAERSVTQLATCGYPAESTEPWRRFPLSTPVPLADAVRTGEPVFVESRDALLTRYPALAAADEGGGGGGDGAWAALPLTAGDRVIGALGMTFDQPRSFQDDDRSYLLTIAGQCALALERARTYAEAERRRANNVAILESITDAFVAMDRSWRITYVNHGAERHFGRSRGDLVGKMITDLFPVVSGSTVAEYYRRVMDTGATVHFETVSPITARWVEVHAYPRPEGIAVFFRDISERKEAEHRLAEQDARERAFFRDVLLSASEGRLRLCATVADLPEPLTSFGDPIDLAPPTLSRLRARIRAAAEDRGISDDRSFDLLTAAGEVAMNAVFHAGGGRAQVRAAGECVQVWVEDQGRGIPVADLPKATLERGYSTRGTLGHGFHLVLSTVDRVWLLTGPTGTKVVLEQDRTPPLPAWARELSEEISHPFASSPPHEGGARQSDQP